MKKNFALFVCAALLVTISSCSKDEDGPNDIPKVTTGLYVLNEGSFNGNNTTLTYYNFSNSTATTDFFANVNGSGLGDTGSDIVIYGSKMYIVMNVSSNIEVADALTAKEITKIPMKDDAGAARQPRYAVGYKNKLLVSSYDGTVAVIDTASLTIDKLITVGSNPEQLVVANDKLFVANSGGLNFPYYDSTVSVVDLSSYTEIKKIVVGMNPGKMAADDNGNVFVVAAGNYTNVAATLIQLDAGTETVKKTLDSSVYLVRVSGDKLYATGGYGINQKVIVFNTNDLSVSNENFITDGTSITLTYGLNIDDANGDVYITDAKNYVSAGEVFCFDKTGKKKFSFSVTPGINPDKVVFVQQ